MNKNGFVYPVIILTVICLVVSGLLAGVNSVTEPIIAEANRIAAEAARARVLPTADTFNAVEDLSAMPAGVNEVYTAANGAGTVVTVSGSGYNGTVKIIVGISSDGTIAGSEVLEHGETVGLGSRIEGEAFRSQFVGKDASLDGVSIIGGSTISSKCFMDLVEEAFKAAELVAGKGA